MIIPIIVLFAVFILIAFRQVGTACIQKVQLVKFRTPIRKTFSLQIWQIMLAGTLIVLFTGQISFNQAVSSINTDILVFLFGMFVVGSALEESGYLSHLSYKLFRHARSVDHLVLFILFGLGAASAVLVNDTAAIAGTSIVIFLAKQHKVSSKPLLLALAFGVTLGSVASPVGNPQNLLIALNGNIENPFITFARYLFLPTIINILAAFLLLKIFYKDKFHKEKLIHEKGQITDHNLAKISRASIFIIVLLIAVKIVSVVLGLNDNIPLTIIAIIGALPVLILSRRRIDILRKVDWYTMIFFAAMFVLMESVWLSGFFQGFLQGGATSIAVILLTGIGVSQFISNVPLVALYMPLLTAAGAGTKELITLAAGSTIAGNLFILGAASNIIIIQNAEKKGETITFIEFARIGIPLTIINAFVYWLFISLA